jgi:hypothetical protein
MKTRRPSKAQTEKVARLALPHLVAAAQQGRTITYGELAAPSFACTRCSSRSSTASSLRCINMRARLRRSRRRTRIWS